MAIAGGISLVKFSRGISRWATPAATRLRF
jgi:hypothetical protein